jgi:hypothetical protein
MRQVYIATNTNGLDGYHILGVYADRSVAEAAVAGLELGTVEAWDITPMFVSKAEERRWEMTRKKFPKVHRTSS